MRCSDGRIYTYETRDEAEKAAKLCYQSQKVYEIVKVEGSEWRGQEILNQVFSSMMI
jgi:hypothetical protein